MASGQKLSDRRRRRRRRHLLRMPIDGEYCCSCLRLGDGVIWSSGGWTKEKADEGEKDDGLPTQQQQQQQRFIITPRIEQQSLCPSV